MERTGLPSIIPFFCLCYLRCMMKFIGLVSVIALYEAISIMVVAFSTNERTIRKNNLHLAGKEGRNMISSRSIGDCMIGKSTVGRLHPLTSHRVGVIGGGLAGLSAAYHLLGKSPSSDITIIDHQAPGNGGASAVAGGLLHPLSPKGKLAYRGIEGLASANKLVQAASQFEENVVLRKKIYRVATDEAQAARFQKTATEFSDFATWIEPEICASGNVDNWEGRYFRREKNVVGALRLSGDCKVLHMRSYLKGLWSYCKSIGSGTKRWIIQNDTESTNISQWEERLAEYGCIVFAAGSGLFQSSILNQKEFPITLVRGQSVEMTLDEEFPLSNAVLCGKYVSPLLEDRRVIIGATHEFKDEPLSPAEVEVELKERSYHFASEPWDNGTIDKVTSGYRVQSNRGPSGRLPIIGKLENSCHPNSWIFTGLSGRGILYHGLYGDLLSDMILGITTQDGDHIENTNWWQK